MEKSATFSPAEALQALREGNARFLSGQPEYPNASKGFRGEGAGIPKPFATVLTDSDSRICPETIFDRGIGDLLVVRVAGNIAEPAVMGSLLLAVRHFESQLVVVLSHESCEAIRIALLPDSVLIREPVGVIKLVELIRENIPESLADPDRNERVVHNAVLENLAATVRAIGDDPFVADRVAGGKLRIVPALYSPETGEITWV